MSAAAVVERYQPRLLTSWATRVQLAGYDFHLTGKLSDARAIRQAEELIGMEAGHAAFHAGRGNFPLTDPALAAIVQGAKVGEKLHALEAFNRAWTRANLAQPVPVEDTAAPVVVDDAGLVYADTLF
ncbi:hypothetical protein AVT46_gp63 [Mycobacterium phage MOOREtheMARYer]|uniref:Uncharacterized protein n=1 Tax=Mycobacterium phage MOOREtheMARYer TaxID=1647309 RepID=A0A0F6YRG0_9CAUD|nr:hypothetical protein AVT46_gp63 [Mycobacterium phage MOOREtheMARYer]AKF14924.1 hypothetical protein SEA_MOORETHEMARYER_63 [Mycobacterium phage MOOREtheMARYer]